MAVNFKFKRENKMIRKISKNPYAHNMLNKIGYSGITFIANALLTRYLGVEFKGEYTWLLNTANLISIIAGLGVYQSIPFFYRQKTDETDIVSEYVNIFILQFIIYCIITGALSCILSMDYTIILIVANLDMLNQQLSMLLLVINIYSRNRIFIIGAIFNFVICAFVLMCCESNLMIAVATVILSKLFYIIGYLFLLRVKINPFTVRLSNMFKKIRFGYLPMLTYLLTTLNYKVDILMLRDASNVSSIQLSLYSVGVSIAELAWFIPDIFKEVLFSKTARENSYEDIAAVIRISNAVMIGVIAGILLLGRFLIGIFYGTDFLEAYKVTVILFLGIPSMSWFKIIYTLLNAQGRRKISFTVLLISSVLNIAINIITIPYWGIYGAAAASVGSYLICGIVFLILFSKIAELPWSSFLILKKKDFSIFRPEK